MWEILNIPGSPAHGRHGDEGGQRDEAVRVGAPEQRHLARRKNRPRSTCAEKNPTN